jgi:hypothetical protein
MKATPAAVRLDIRGEYTRTAGTDVEAFKPLPEDSLYRGGDVGDAPADGGVVCAVDEAQAETQRKRRDRPSAEAEGRAVVVAHLVCLGQIVVTGARSTVNVAWVV